MQFTLVGVAVEAEEPAVSAAWFTRHFGFMVGIDDRDGAAAVTAVDSAAGGADRRG